jgi:hypothetical protein
MICPKCKEEYRDGFSKCSDCNVDLVDQKEIIEEKCSIRTEGIKLIKFGIILLFIAFAEMMIVVLTYEISLTYMRTHGFMVDIIFVNLINPIIWYIFAVEIVSSLAIIVWGISFKEKIVKKKNI